MGALALPDVLAPMPELPAVLDLQDAMLALPQADFPVFHHFADGQYGREMHMAADTVAIGKMHRYSTLNILLKGELTCTTDTGIRRMTAPAIFVSPPACKKVLLAHTDVVFMTVHPTKLTNPDDIELKFIVEEHLPKGK